MFGFRHPVARNFARLKLRLGPAWASLLGRAKKYIDGSIIVLFLLIRGV